MLNSEHDTVTPLGFGFPQELHSCTNQPAFQRQVPSVLSGMRIQRLAFASVRGSGASGKDVAGNRYSWASPCLLSGATLR